MHACKGVCAKLGVQECMHKGGRARAGVRGRWVGGGHAAERAAARRGLAGAQRVPLPPGGCEGAAETNCNTSHSSAHLFLMNA